MIKRGQFSSLYAPALQGKDLNDIYRAIQRDISISQSERADLIAQLQRQVGNVAGTTPLGVLLSYGSGGILGFLIAKYLGMGATGRAVSAAVGTQLGRMVYDRFSKPKDGLPGWTLL